VAAVADVVVLRKPMFSVPAVDPPPRCWSPCRADKRPDGHGVADASRIDVEGCRPDGSW